MRIHRVLLFVTTLLFAGSLFAEPRELRCHKIRISYDSEIKLSGKIWANKKSIYSGLSILEHEERDIGKVGYLFVRCAESGTGIDGEYYLVFRCDSARLVGRFITKIDTYDINGNLISSNRYTYDSKNLTLKSVKGETWKIDFSSKTGFFPKQ